MVFVPDGFAHCVMPIKHTNLVRSAAITWGAEASVAVQATADNISGNFKTAMMTQFDNAVTVGPMTCNIGVGGGETLAFIAGVATVGGSASDSLPPNTALLINKQTDTPGRRGRGRLFLPWAVSEDDVDEVGIVALAARNAADVRLADWLLNAGPANPLHVLHSDPLVPPSLIVNLSVQSLIANQRRRLGR